MASIVTNITSGQEQSLKSGNNTYYPISGNLTAEHPWSNRLIDVDPSTYISDFSIFTQNQIRLNIDHYNETWYTDAVPIGLQFANVVKCSWIKVWEKEKKEILPL